MFQSTQVSWAGVNLFYLFGFGIHYQRLLSTVPGCTQTFLVRFSSFVVIHSSLDLSQTSRTQTSNKALSKSRVVESMPGCSRVFVSVVPGLYLEVRGRYSTGTTTIP